MHIFFDFLKKNVLVITIVLLVLGCIAGAVVAGLYYLKTLPVVEQKQDKEQSPPQYESNISYEQAIIDATKLASPSVVSIIVSKNLPIYEVVFPQNVQNGTELREVGAGSGFIVSADGLILTNKHVVSDSEADYTVLANDGQKYKAKVLALDPVQDLAIVKIEDSKAQFQPIKIGDSSGLQLGQTVIAIGNALGQFSNTVSVGIVSGLQRTILASDKPGGLSEVLAGIIQTDAAINQGNSGGPLLNLKGEVIGINTAIAEDAQSVGFAIPINTAKRDIQQVSENNKIIYPFLGVRYVAVDKTIQQEYKLSVDYGALVLKGNNGEPAVTAESGAAKAGIKENDIILEINGEKITDGNLMSTIVQKYNPGDKITLRILRDSKEQNIEAVLGERSS
jgi:S1-C subfamily serine protease